MRTPFIAGNWKMNTTLSEAAGLVSEMRARLDGISGVDKAVCPPFVSLKAVKDILEGSSVKIGAQDVYFEEKGAYTGEISPLMLKGLCDYVIIGHSERRQHFGDTLDIVNKKVQATVKAGIKPILCVGETLEQNEAGATEDTVKAQLSSALKGIAATEGLAIAYEPIWAIGTGRAASPDEAGRTIAFIRDTLADLYGSAFAEGARILYGGSVNAANADNFLSEPSIDGALVGGASLKANEFIAICDAAQAKGK